MTEMKFRIGDRVAVKQRAGKIGEICDIDAARRRYRIQWASKRTWMRESSLIRVDRDPDTFYSPQ